MTVLTGTTLSDIGIDGVALKPSEVAIERARSLDIGTVTIDYEGREHVPAPALLEDLANDVDVRLTIPVRADGFDPLGNDTVRTSVPATVDEVLVAGHPTYLSSEETKRAVAPRLEAAQQGSSNPWIGTEGIERVAMAVGGTQFELLSNTTKRDVTALRAAGFDGELAIYAPTVLSDDPDTVLDAVGAYTARRRRVSEQLPGDVPTDSSIRGRAREQLLGACHEYALVGSPETVARRVETLHNVGVDYVVSYPARGLAEYC